MEKHQRQKRVQKVKDNISKIQRIANIEEGIMQSLHREMTGRIFNKKFIKAVSFLEAISFIVPKKDLWFLQKQ